MERTGIGSLLIGIGMGAAMAMLFTPSSGPKTRARITKAANEGATHFKGMCDSVIDMVEHSKDQIAKQKEGVSEAIKRGSEAYRRAVS
jgi:gas vesicle protein